MKKNAWERLPIEPEISYYGMIAAFETLGGEWKRSSDGKHWLIWMGVAAIAPQAQAAVKQLIEKYN